MPIFIVGFARSGTTLCQKLVSQHLGIPTLPETHYFEFLEDHEPAGGFIRPDSARELLRQLERFLQIDVAALKPLLSRDEVPIRPLFLHLVGQQIGSQPLADKGQWIEKTPGHAEHLERIYQMFPKARFICMVRDPVHAFASRRELQTTGRGWGEAWKPIEAFCAQWAEHVRNFRSFGERHPGQLMAIRLEDLASNPLAELARVRDFVGPGFATPVDAPLHPDIVQPFETWKRDALKPADATIADRAGKGLLDDYETWRVKTLLREPMSAFGYAVDAAQPPGLDDLHRRMVASLDWYVEQFLRRDALMDVKTARIRSLLNDLAERGTGPGIPMPPRPMPAIANPLLVARVGAPARNDATASSDPVPLPAAPVEAAGPPGPPGPRESSQASGAVADEAVFVSPDEPKVVPPTVRAGGPRTAGGGPVRAGSLSGGGGKARGAGPAMVGKPGARQGPKAGGRGRAGPRAGGTHAQRQGRNFVTDNDGPLDDNLPAAWRPLTLHGISGVNDNGETFLAEAAEIVAKRAAHPAGRSPGESGDDITDATE